MQVCKGNATRVEGKSFADAVQGKQGANGQKVACSKDPVQLQILKEKLEADLVKVNLQLEECPLDDSGMTSRRQEESLMNKVFEDLRKTLPHQAACQDTVSTVIMIQGGRLTEK